MRHRKLFLSQNGANSTSECGVICDPNNCPFTCYPDIPIVFPPQPPPLPRPNRNGAGEDNLSIVIIVVPLIAICFLYCCSRLCNSKVRSGGSRRNSEPPPPEAGSLDNEFVDENRMDHPIWLITTIGLQQSTIDSIGVCRYKKREELIERSDCSVCLSEFQEGESLRLLPKCNHAFHLPCIDTWLRSHKNCPLCRANIVVVTPTPNQVIQIENNSVVEFGYGDGGCFGNRGRTVDVEESEADIVPEEEGTISFVSEDSQFENSNSPNLKNRMRKIEKWRWRNGRRRKRASVIERCLHQSPVSMKRSNRMRREDCDVGKTAVRHMQAFGGISLV